MRKFVCALLALACLISGALAEEGECRAGTGAAKLGDSLFFAVHEGGTDALVRCAAGKPMLAARAEAICSLLTHGGDLYYLEKTDGAWTLMRRGEMSAPGAVYAFDTGADVRVLSACGEELFALVDGQLHVLYPEKKLCLRLASTEMREYAVDGEYAYFVSAADIVRYELPSPTGTVSAEAGCLYRLNLSTGNTSLVMKAGVEDLRFRDGKLYFHSLSDAYLQGENAVAGKLYSFDLATETLARWLSDYDWDYFPTAAGLLVYRADGVTLVTPGGTETTVRETGPRAEVYFADGEILVYDPDALSFAAYSIPAP